MNAIQQATQDMSLSKIIALSGLVIAAVAYCWLSKLAEDRRIARLARAAARPYLAYAVDELDRQGGMLLEHDRALNVLTADPEQAEIDAAIAESDAEEAEAEAYAAQAQVGRRVIA